MNDKSTNSALARDILEWCVPKEVLAVLLKDRSTGRNLIWATDDYAASRNWRLVRTEGREVWYNMRKKGKLK